MTRRVHMSASVRGMLNWDRQYTRRMMKTFTHDDGKPFTSVEEFRNAMMDLLTQGIELIPVGDACEGFDPKTGCPGHEVPEKEAVSA